MKRLINSLAALTLSVSSLLLINLGTAFATANNCTWTGATNNNFNTSTNWSSCNSTVPQAGDNLVFDNTSLANPTTLNNDINSLSVGSITFSGTGSYAFSLGGNPITITSGMSNTTNGCFGGGCYTDISNNLVISGAQTFNAAGGISLSGNLSGSGLITTTGSGYLSLSGDNFGFSGGFSTSSGEISVHTSTGLGTGQVTVTDGATLNFDYYLSALNISTPISVGGNGDGSYPAVYLANRGASGTAVTLSGNVALTSNVQVAGAGTGVLKVTGPLSGNYTLTAQSGQDVSVDIESSNNTSASGNGTQQSQLNVVTVNAGDNQPGTQLTITNNNEYIIDGVRGDTYVNQGGTLKGSGTVGHLTVNSGGIVAPGHSPGCLNTGNLTLNGTYQAEIGGTTACSGYDQLQVTGTVDVTGATLTPSLYNNYKPKAGETYTIISNDGSDAVTGTFTGLPEGATFNVSGYVMKISYKGGDGNDVVLTVVSVPKTPDTGLAFTGSHPGLTLGLTSLSALSLYGISRRYRKSPGRR